MRNIWAKRIFYIFKVLGQKVGFNSVLVLGFSFLNFTLREVEVETKSSAVI